MRTCAICGAPMSGLDGRYKYCSDECAVEAHRRQCRVNFRRYYRENRTKELERNRQYYARKKRMRPMAQEK